MLGPYTRRRIMPGRCRSRLTCHHDRIKIMITSSDRKLHVCYARAGTGARGAVHGLCALAIAVSAYACAQPPCKVMSWWPKRQPSEPRHRLSVRAPTFRTRSVGGARGSVNSKTELIGILRTLPGGDSNVPSSWRARPPVTAGTKRKGV